MTTIAAPAPASRDAARGARDRRLDRLFDRWNRCTVSVGGRRVSSFKVWGLTGLAVAVALGVGLIESRGLSVGVIALVSLSAMATFLALTLLTKVLTGCEELIYYHHEIAILAVAAGLLRLLDQPVLPYLDVTILGVGTFLAFGRIGCFMVGCCHGRPCAVGVRYRHEHADAGFPRYLVGTRLLPVQLLEAAAVGVTVAVGVALWLRGSQPGAVLVWYSIAYGVARYALEPLRGDPARRYLGALSEGQWTTVALLGLVVLGGLTGRLPAEAWHLLASAAVFVAAAVSLTKRGPERRLLRVRHLCEIARLLDAATEEARAAGASRTATTSRGIVISADVVHDGADALRIWSLSAPRLPLPAGALERLAGSVARLKGIDEPCRPSAAGVVHLVIADPGGAHAV